MTGTTTRRSIAEYWSAHRGEVFVQLGLQLLVGAVVGLGVGAGLFVWQASV